MIEGCEDQEDDEFPMYEEEIVIGDSDKEEGLALVMKKTLLAPKQQEQEDWLRSNIFHTTCNISGRICNLVIDGGSYENVVSEKVVDKLGLKTVDHPHPYKLTWLKKGNNIRIFKRCMVSFSIRKKFQDSVFCDVVKMDACHLLLGRPWQYDRHTNHDGRKNTYNLYKDGQHYTLLPMKEKVILKTPTIQPNSLLIVKKFAQETLATGVVYMLLTALELDAMIVPQSIKELIKSFEDVFPNELPTKLPPMRDIACH